MGTYPSGNGNTSLVGQGITWKVLAVDSTNKRALVISEKVLFNMQLYTAATSSDHKTYTYKWSNCDINTYLNGSFLADYGLSDVEIASVSHETEKGVSQDAETTSEKVFLLSTTEANTYFTDDTACIAYNLSDSTCSWWLRSPSSSDSYRVAGVNDDGYVNAYGYYVYLSLGVRPAFWVNL